MRNRHEEGGGTAGEASRSACRGAVGPQPISMHISLPRMRDERRGSSAAG